MPFYTKTHYVWGGAGKEHVTSIVPLQAETCPKHFSPFSNVKKNVCHFFLLIMSPNKNTHCAAPVMLAATRRDKLMLSPKLQGVAWEEYICIPENYFLRILRKSCFSGASESTQSRLIQIWTIRISGQFQVTWKSHVAYIPHVFICAHNSKFSQFKRI